LVFGEVSTGAQNDLMRASDLARSMVTEYGMSDVIGPVSHEGHRRGQFMENPFGADRGVYAEDTARIIDSEVKRIIVEAQQRAAGILASRRPLLDEVAEKLLVKEVIEGEDLRLMMHGPAAAPAPVTSAS
jgi:cell division protease FtsH